MHRIFSFFMAAIIFLVTVGIPVFHHRCASENTSYTRWFFFNDSHCENKDAPPCCKKKKSDCCSVDSEIIALKTDQVIDQPYHGFPVFSRDIASPPRCIEGFRCVQASFPRTIERIYPPPKLAHGRTLLNLLQVFRI
jgi:hypothetical protein